MNKRESSLLKNALCQVWLKLTQWFWRKRYFNFVHVFSLFLYYLHVEKGGAPHLNKLESPSPKDALCQVWLKLVVKKIGSEEEDENVKSLRQQQRRRRRLLIRKAHLSLRLRWAKKVIHMRYMTMHVTINRRAWHIILYTGISYTQLIISSTWDILCIRSINYLVCILIQNRTTTYPIFLCLKMVSQGLYRILINNQAIKIGRVKEDSFIWLHSRKHMRYFLMSKKSFF